MSALKRLGFGLTVALLVLAGAQAAFAAWSKTANASGYGKALSMPTGNTPTASSSGTSVTVSWAQSTFSGGTPVAGYLVKRYGATTGVLQTIGSACSGTISGLSCTETNVPVGSWKYTVTPKQNSWTGTEGTKSSAVSVTAALTAASLTTNHPAAASSMTTASISPATSVVFAWVTYVNTSGTPPTVSSISGLSCTWATVGNVLSVNGNRRLSLWNGTGCSGSGTVTITPSATPTSANAYDLIEYTGGINPTTPYVSTNVKTGASTASAMSLTVTPNALGSTSNAFVVGLNHAKNEDVTKSHASSVEINDDNLSSAVGIETNGFVGWASGVMGGSWSTNTGAQATIVGVEIQAAVAPTAPTISSAPSNPTNQTSASFSFTGQAGVTFQCELDAGGYSTCTSPQAYAGLSEGSHTFQVFAKNSAGSESSITSSTWTIDTTAPPTPSITSAPASLTNSTNASFSFTDTEGGVTFQCQLDAGGYSSCTSPKAYSSLTDGSHTFSVKAVDAATNQSSAATSTWTVDATAPPTPSITSAPTSPTTATNASFSFTDTEGGVTFQCQLDAGGYSSCTSPKSYGSLAEGSHTFSVRAVDAATNNSAAATSTWIVDLTNPTTAITFPVSSSTYATSVSGSYELGCGTATAYDVCGTSSDANGVSSVRVSIRQGSGNYWNGSSFASSTEVLIGASGTTSWSYVFNSFPAEGAYTLRAVATDAAGNTSSASTTFSIDNTAPAVAITFPVNGSTYGASAYNAGCATSGLCGTSSDAVAVSSVKVSILQVSAAKYYNGSTWTSTTETQLTAAGTTSWSYALASSAYPADGSYTVKAYATDSAGNVTSATSTFTRDTTGPTGTDVQTTNKAGGTAGKAEQGDTITFTFSEAINPGSILSGWNGSSTPVWVRITDGGVGNDTVTIRDSGNANQLPLGSVNLGRIDYVTATSDFGGAGVNAGAMVMSGNTITITLGKAPTSGVLLAVSTGAMVWTPSTTAIDLSGNACSTTNATETGTSDTDF